MEDPAGESERQPSVQVVQARDDGLLVDQQWRGHVDLLILADFPDLFRE